MTRPTIPSVLPLFISYRRRHGAWGSLHIVLDDGNVRDSDVGWCIEHARERGDAEGEALGRVLLAMSRTQRRKLGAMA